MKELNKNKFSLLLVTSLLLLASFAVVSATVTMVTPASSATISGDIVSWNVTITGGFGNVTSCDIYLSSPSTANSTALNVSSNVNITEDAEWIANASTSEFVTTDLEDSNDYSIYASCTNGTIENSSVVTITIDNYAPTAPTSLSPSAGSSDDDGSVTFSATVLGANTTACTLYFPFKNPGLKSYAMIHSGNSCTYTNPAIAEETYTYIIEASDGTDGANTSQITFDVIIDTPSNYLFSQEAQKKTSKTLSLTGDGPIGIPIWVIALIVIGVLTVAMRRRKKK